MNGDAGLGPHVDQPPEIVFSTNLEEPTMKVRVVLDAKVTFTPDDKGGGPIELKDFAGEIEGQHDAASDHVETECQNTTKVDDGARGHLHSFVRATGHRLTSGDNDARSVRRTLIGDIHKPVVGRHQGVKT